jgi:SAM-dependent methyltransferase
MKPSATTALCLATTSLSIRAVHTLLHQCPLSIIRRLAAGAGPRSAFRCLRIEKGLLGTSTTRPFVQQRSLLGMTTKTPQMLDSPSAQRNKEPIWEVLKSNILDLRRPVNDDNLFPPLKVLEVAAGTGQHAYYLADQMQSYYCQQRQPNNQKDDDDDVHVVWYPTDAEEPYRESIRAYAAAEHSSSLVMHPLPLVLDAAGIQEATTKSILQQVAPFDLIVNINMIHIAPWSATQGLMKEASNLLAPHGTLFLYGPYKVHGRCCASNQSFDESLQRRNPEWGVRNLEQVVALAATHGLYLRKSIEMPANNLSLLFT